MATVAEFIADFLYKNGITDIFMLSGGGAIHLDQAVENHKGLRAICIKNEATGPMMAKAYAQLKNNFGVVYVTTGPGGANAVTGVVECFVDSSPVLIISGQAPLMQTTKYANINGLRSFGVQELNIIDVVTPITKYARMITNPAYLLHELQKAIAIAKEPRPGPVWLDIPLDIQSAELNENTLTWEYEPIKETHDASLYKVDLLIDELRKSLRPLIVAGQGIRISGAIEQLKELAQTIDAPIIFSRMGLDTIPFSYKYNMGIGGFKGSKYNKQIMKEADLIISIGTSLSVAFAGHNLSFFNENAKVFMIDIEEAEANKFVRRLTSFDKCDAKLFINKLLQRLYERKSVLGNPQWMTWCTDLKEKYHAHKLAEKKNPIDIYYLVKSIDRVSTENDVFVDDAGSIYYVASQTLTFEKGQREVTSGAFASMGNAIPLAIGCAIANPNIRVLAMTGDGSLETNIQELKTLSYYELNVKLFVINNGGYISMRDHGRHVVGEQNGVVSLNKIADAYGMPYLLIHDYQQLKNLDELISIPGPQFIEVLCDNNQKLILPV